jgi:hypothetical protein
MALMGQHRPATRLLAAGMPVVVACLLLPLRGHTVNVNLALVLVLAVLAGGAIAGRLGGVLAAVTAALSFDILLTRPYGSLRIDGGDDVVTTILLAAVGVTSAILVERVRRHAAQAATTASSLQRLERVTELNSGSQSRERLVRLACDELTSMLDLKACRYAPGPPPVDSIRFEHGFVRVPAMGEPGPAGQAVLPVRHKAREVGHFVLVFPNATPGLGVPESTRRTAVAVADAVGAGYLDDAGG